MNPLFDGIILSLFTCEQYTLFHSIRNNNRLTQKQQAYLLSIKSSFILFVLSLCYNYSFVMSGFDFSKLTESSSTYQFLQQMSVLFLISHLIMDTYLGNRYYHSYMTNLSGYPHHIIYIFICSFSLYSGWYPLFLLYFIAELPTFILALGSFDKNYRNDNLFGITFLFTRILYHIFLTYKLTQYSGYSFVTKVNLTTLATLILFVHCYWFKKWIKKYWYKQKRD
jgi:hypothetical protein